nr:hypothetical protein [Bradyrhizobium sp. KBS0725]
MALDHPCAEIQRRKAAGAGNELAVLDKQLIGNRNDVAITLDQILEMIPADTASAPAHQLGFDQRKAAGADAGDRHALCRRVAEKFQGLGVIGCIAIDESTDHHDVIKPFGFAESLPRQHLQTAARGDGIEIRRQYAPRTSFRPASIALVGGQPQQIHNRRKCNQCEIGDEHKAN